VQDDVDVNATVTLTMFITVFAGHQAKYRFMSEIALGKTVSLQIQLTDSLN